MTWETLNASIRDALEQTAPTDTEVLARVRQAGRLRQRASSRPSWPVGGLFLTAGVSVAVGALWLLPELSPRAPVPSIGKDSLTSVSSEEAPAGRPPVRSSGEDAASVPAPLESNRAVSPTPPASRVRAGASVNAPPPPVLPSWEEVAQAMRAGEDERARSLILRLEESSDVETRQYARLTAWQLRLRAQDGQGALSASELEELRLLGASGATSSIRVAARQLLERSSAAVATKPGTTDAKTEPGTASAKEDHE